MPKTLKVNQAAVGLAMLAWTVFLVPHTGFLWWIAGNFIAAVLALRAAIERSHARTIALVAVCIFVISNGIAAALACSGGGACAVIITVLVLFSPLQVAVALRAWTPSVPTYRND